MKPLRNSDLNARPDVLRAKYQFGTWFGAAMGFVFAIATWGLDAYWLAIANGLLPWLKFLAGAILCMIVGGITGRFSAQMDKPLLSMFFWLITAIFFAWLIVALPLQIFPGLLSSLSLQPKV